ncbi:hypothetical protein P171DRAFT_276763 [Karstenula rhodostoma CBS 690.94]|uniref:Uncharacterized protein n=1 Tax=Karstenula rhodostoma CBS 690.94 TaxID=1392251 RepID=A0A9P4PN43_9PLEO|nr:hypothetical protein P171DRAFT_276763 [Karstenula rhodostoma CBS 690.94]
MSDEQSDSGVRSAPLLLRIPGELRNQIYKYILEHILNGDGYRYFGGLLPRNYGGYHHVAFFLDPDRHEARQRKVNLLQVCRVLRQEFRPLLLKAPLDIPMNLAAKYIDAFYPLSTPFPAETELPPCRILLKRSPEPEPVYIAQLLRYLYDRPQFEFEFEGESLAQDLNFLFTHKDRALAWKYALRSTVKEIVYTECQWHGGHTEVPDDIYRLPGKLYILIETHGLRLGHLIDPSRSSVPVPIHEHLADLGLVRKKHGPINLSSSHNSGMTRQGQLRRDLGFVLKKSI